MASTANFLSCDYLDRCALPHAFMSERAELVHVNEQISLLDDHISQLTTLRHTLLHRTRQLQNQLLPIHALPLEIMSNIFQQLVSLHDYDYSDFYSYRRCLRQAFDLGSVSSQFRHAAFGTSDLWRIPLDLTEDEGVGKVTPLLQHCVALMPGFSLSVLGTHDEEKARSAIDILLTPDTVQKIRGFNLDDSSSAAAKLWIDKLKCSPRLNTLSLNLEISEPFVLDFKALTAVTRLLIHIPWVYPELAVPPSVEYLQVSYISQQLLVSLLHQCPNLVECDVTIDDDEDEWDADTHINKPLILARLKWLHAPIINAIRIRSSAEYLQLPSLESLELYGLQTDGFIEAISLCRKVSGTLATLSIFGISEEIDYIRLYQLLRISFPRLRELELQSSTWPSFLGILTSFVLLESECNSSRPHYFPALKSITLHCIADINPRFLLGILKGCRIGEVFHFDIQFNAVDPIRHQWSPELGDELRSIVGSRQIEITWGTNKVYELGVQDGSL